MFFKGRKPDWLYEALPSIYLVTGLVTLAAVQNLMGAVSGLMLLAAAGSVWSLRHRYRRERQHNAVLTARSAALRGDGSGSAFQVVWRDAFAVGHEVLDGQHRKLFGLGNEIITAISSKRSREEVEMLLYNLVQDMEIHFRSEEEIMAGENNPLPDDHKESHHSLLNRLKLLRTRYCAGQLQASELLGFIAYDIVAQHIGSEKMKFCYQPAG
jgi:hemerythrin-like metal-binding protein